MRCRILLFLLSAQFFSFLTYSQSLLQSLNDTNTVKAGETDVDAPPILAKKWNQFRTKYFTLNIGIAFLLDHNITNQNAANVEQVGNIGSATELRADRLILSGNLLFFKRPWHYTFTLNYNGLDGTEAFSVLDLSVQIPIGDKYGWITIGKQKEGVSHEFVSTRTQLLFTERGTAVPAFINRRNYGIRYNNTALKNRLTYAFGIFNSWLDKGNENSFAENGVQLTSRITGLPVYSSDRNLMHVGLNWRYTDALNGKLTYQAKPEVNTAPNFLNTGSFDGIRVWEFITLIGEYMQTFVNSSSRGNPSLSYWQLAGSWFITGENRTYNRQTGNLGKITPRRNFRFRKPSGFGAFEIVARFTNSNFNDQLITGGKFTRFTVGLSWYPNAHFRFIINYGNGTLNKNDLSGNAQFWQFRAQFEL
jgi:phosphate-selective porin OprO and OprP